MSGAALKLDLEDDIKRRIEALQQFQVLGDLRKDEVAMRAFATQIRDVCFEVGDKVFEEGKVGEEVYFLISGRCTVSRTTLHGDSFPVSQIGSEEHPLLGEGGLIDEEPRTATLTVEERCHCLGLTRERFEVFCKEHPEWALPVLRRVAQSVLQRLRKTNEEFVMLYSALVSEVQDE